MPFYDFTLPVPAGTPETAPAAAEARLSKGHVTGVEVLFPDGCAGLVATACYREAAQVWPSNPDGAFSSNGETLRWDEDYPLDDEPLLFVLRAWAPESRFPHTVTWRFELLPLDRAQERVSVPGLLGRIAEFIGVGQA